MNPTIHTAYFSDTKKATAMHYHDCHQLLFIIKGTAELYINGNKTTAKAGSVAIFSRYENHSVNVISDEYERFVLTINPISNYIEHKEYALLLNRPSGFENVIDISCSSDKVKTVFHNIIEEKNRTDEYSEEMQHALLNQLLITICRSSAKSFFSLPRENFNMVFEIQKMFECDYGRAYSLDELAKSYAVSVSTLTHLFKKATGYSVFDYLTSCRIASAKYFLAKSNLPVGSIVEKCGFSDNSNFSRMFKKAAGMTPSQFRSEHQKA